MSDAERMVGLWGLVGYRRTEADGSGTEPFGAAPVGRLLYTAEGYMSAHIMPAGAGAEGVPPVSMVAYCGDWRLDGGVVTHDVLIGSGTIASGSTVTRDVGWEGDDLILSAPGWRQGEAEGARRLHWRRV